MLGPMRDSRRASRRSSGATGETEQRAAQTGLGSGRPCAADPPRRYGPPSGPPRTPNDPARDAERGLATKQRPKADRPPRFKVILYNDDYTPMEFVVQVLEKVFGKSPSAATQIMLQIHRSGLGVAGVYVLEIAETKSATVLRMAEERGYPLRSGVEKE